jgi:hypothetical protein
MTESAWTQFLQAFRAYRSRGGRKDIKTLIDSVILAVVRLRRPELDEATGEDAIMLMSSLFAPSSRLEAFDRFKRLKMTGNDLSMDALMEYVLQFSRLQAMCGEAATPPDEMLQKEFVKGLRPKRLADRVRLREPSTPDEAKSFAMQEMEALIKVAAEAQLLQFDRAAATTKPKARGQESGHGWNERRSGSDRHPSFRSQEQKRPPHAEHGRRDQGRPNVTQLKCHGCGHNGHRRSECPHRDHPAWFATGQRLKPLDLRRADEQTKMLKPQPGQGRGHKPSSDIIGAKPITSQTTMVVNQGSLTIDKGVPRITITLIADDGSTVPVRALIDTGSSVSMISPKLYRQLLSVGVAVRQRPQMVTVANGATVETEWEVDCMVQFIDDAGRQVRTPVSLTVMDMGEDVLLSCNDALRLDLIDLLKSSANAHQVKNRDGADAPTTTKLAEPVSDEAGEQLAEKIRELIGRYAEVFDETLPPGGASVGAMPIDLKPGQAPRAIPPRRVSPAIREVIREEVDTLTKLGIINPSLSPYSSPIVVVRKKDGSYRMCVDYRHLNTCTEDMRFPLQNAKALLERMAGKRVFGTLDLRSGFHQVPLHPDAVPLTAFATPDGLYEYTRVPFGLKNAPPFFQQTMTRVLSGLVDNVCQVFIDDIIVYGEDDTQFLHNLELVLERLRAYNFRVKHSKCCLGKREVEYLGHIVNGEGIALSPSRKQALYELQPPKSTAQLRSFMGLVNYFRAFVPRFAQTAKPLTRMCSEKVPFRWDEEHEQAFTQLKQRVIDAPMLHHLDYSLPIILRTDASTTGAGGVLLQVIDGQERVVCYVSRAFNDTESRWSTIEQEAYAIYYCVTSLSHHLLGHKFIVETDHKNLRYIDSGHSPKLDRWRLRLQEYDFTVKHIPGHQNTVADALSRCFAVTAGDTTGEYPHVEKIREVHNAVVGHRGLHKTLELLRDSGVVWSGMKEDVSKFIAACPTCQKVRLGQGSIAAALRTTAAREPFEMVAVDTIGPLPPDEAGNKFIIVAIDCFTRFVELFPTPTTTAKCAARALLHVFGRYGAPKQLRSDQGTQYTARVISELLQLIGTERSLTLPYCPQANGIVERANGEVMRHLRAITTDRRIKDKWSEVLPLVQRLVNATPHTAIGTAPARVLYGGMINLDRELIRSLPEGGEGVCEGVAQSDVVMEDYIKTLIDKQSIIIDACQKHQDDEIKRRLHNTPESPTTYDVGDYVLVSYPERPPTKLTPRWRGPLAVVEADGDKYLCQDLRTQKVLPFHVSRLKRYVMDDTPDAVDVAAADDDEYIVEAIVDHRGPPTGRPRKELEFRVRWKGYEPDEDTWLPYNEVSKLEALDAYSATHPELRL